MRKIAIAFLGAALMLTGQGLSGRRAPSFSLPDSSMKQHDLLDYRGRWLLVDFMRTDCPHCLELTKLLESKKAQFGAKVAVLAVVIAPPDNQATVAKYIATSKTTSPVVFDQGQMAISFFKATPTNSSFDTPHLFAINPQGMIVKDWTEAGVESPGFAAELDALLTSGAAKK
jgi:peroxiredoxin